MKAFIRGYGIEWIITHIAWVVALVIWFTYLAKP